jgi:hypothetical protein
MTEEPSTKLTALLFYFGDANHESLSNILCSSDNSFSSAQEAFVDFYNKFREAFVTEIRQHSYCEHCKTEREEQLPSEVFMTIAGGDVHHPCLDVLAQLGWNVGSFTLDCIACMREPTRLVVIPNVEVQMKCMEFYPDRKVKVDGEYIINITVVKKELPIDDSTEEEENV